MGRVEDSGRRVGGRVGERSGDRVGGRDNVFFGVSLTSAFELGLVRVRMGLEGSLGVLGGLDPGLSSKIEKAGGVFAFNVLFLIFRGLGVVSRSALRAKSPRSRSPKLVGVKANSGISEASLLLGVRDVFEGLSSGAVIIEPLSIFGSFARNARWSRVAAWAATSKPGEEGIELAPELGVPTSSSTWADCRSWEGCPWKLRFRIGVCIGVSGLIATQLGDDCSELIPIDLLGDEASGTGLIGGTPACGTPRYTGLLSSSIELRLENSIRSPSCGGLWNDGGLRL